MGRLPCARFRYCCGPHGPGWRALGCLQKRRKEGRKRGGDRCINDMSAVWVGVVVGGWTYLRRSTRRARALSLSLYPSPFLRHTHACDLIHRVYDHLASPRHRGCVAMNTMRVWVTIPTGWPPCSFGSAVGMSSFHDERVWGRRGGVDI